MKFNIYFGSHLSEEDELLNTTNTLTEAENFVFQHIKNNHISHYIRTNIVSETERWYDYGSYTNFYTIIGK